MGLRYSCSTKYCGCAAELLAGDTDELEFKGFLVGHGWDFVTTETGQDLAFCPIHTYDTTVTYTQEQGDEDWTSEFLGLEEIDDLPLTPEADNPYNLDYGGF
jgi:hypothetical protein